MLKGFMPEPRPKPASASQEEGEQVFSRVSYFVHLKW
jgi:hypothetical protein